MKNRRSSAMMRRASILMAASLFLLATAAAPAAAEDNEFVETGSFTFVDVNPCSGLDQEITVNFVAHVHESDEGVEVNVDRTGTTSDGYVLDGGQEEFRAEGDGVEGQLEDEWHRSDGSSFLAKGKFVVDSDTGEVLVDEFSLTCADD